MKTMLEAKEKTMKRAMARWSVGLSVVVLAAFTLLSASTGDAQQKIIGEEHWVQSISAADGKLLKIYLWEKRSKDVDVKQFAAAGRVVLLAHGASI